MNVQRYFLFHLSLALTDYCYLTLHLCRAASAPLTPLTNVCVVTLMPSMRGLGLKRDRNVDPFCHFQTTVGF